jgi:hypothetical protein
MPYASIIGCDMCPAVTGDAESFCKIDGHIERKTRHDRIERLPLATNERTCAILCPSCAEPILKFQRDLAEKSKDGEGRLRDRILSAIQKTE